MMQKKATKQKERLVSFSPTLKPVDCRRGENELHQTQASAHGFSAWTYAV